MSDSRWYFAIYEGLLRPKHYKEMGQAVWLYLYIVSLASAAQNDGICDYNHQEAGHQLGTTPRNVRRWFSTLQETGYIHTRARHQYHLEVQVSNWRTPAEFLDARKRAKDKVSLPDLGDGRSPPDRTELSHLDADGGREDEKVRQIGRQIGHQIGQNCPPSININLPIYLVSPSGGGSEPTLRGFASVADLFQFFIGVLDASDNPVAVLVRLYEVFFGRSVVAGSGDKYSRMGGAYKAFKDDAGYLVRKLWEQIPSPPAGNVLNYVTKAVGRKNGRQSGAHEILSDADDAIREWVKGG